MKLFLLILSIVSILIWAFLENEEIDQEVTRLTLGDTSDVFNAEAPEASVVALAQLYDLKPMILDKTETEMETESDLGADSDYCQDMDTTEKVQDLRTLSELSLSLHTNHDLKVGDVKEVRDRITAIKETYQIPMERRESWPIERVALAEAERLSDDRIENMEASEYKNRLSSYGGSLWLEQYYVDVILRNGYLEKWDSETISRLNEEKELEDALSNLDNSAGLPDVE